jgi:SAM-dependent methyltransferase
LTCDLLFFVPVEPSDVLVGHYAALAEERWTGDSRPDWTLARHAILGRMPTGSVLDVGCWTGGFLATLPPQYEKRGVEPSPWARDRAVDKGVAFVGNSLEELVSSRATYDAATMIDVIEHTTAPLEALALAAGGLKDQGFLVVTTGNSRALPWRLMPRDYWYYFAEHVCFFSQRWFRWAAAQLDLRIEEVTRFSHFPAERRGTPIAELGRASAFRLLGGSRALPVRVAQRAHMLRGHVETHHWRDHMLVVLRKSPPDAC